MKIITRTAIPMSQTTREHQSRRARNHRWNPFSYFKNDSNPHSEYK